MTGYFLVMRSATDQTAILRAHRFEMAAVELARNNEPQAAYAAKIVAAITRSFIVEFVGLQQQAPVERLFYTELKECAEKCKVPDDMLAENAAYVQRMTAAWATNMWRTSYVERRRVKLPRHRGEIKDDKRVADMMSLARIIVIADNDFGIDSFESGGPMTPAIRRHIRTFAFRP